MSEEKTEAVEEVADSKSEVQMEEMAGAIYRGLKQGVGTVVGGVGKVANYSWLGMKYAAGDLKGVSQKVTERGKAVLQKSGGEEKVVEATPGS